LGTISDGLPIRRRSHPALSLEQPSPRLQIHSGKMLSPSPFSSQLNRNIYLRNEAYRSSFYFELTQFNIFFTFISVQKFERFDISTREVKLEDGYIHFK